MEFYELFGFLTILSESIKLLPKNGKLMSVIVVFTVVLSSGIFLLFNYSIQTLSVQMFVNLQQSFMPDPSSFDLPDPSSFNVTDPNPNTFTPPLGFDPALITNLLIHMREDFAPILAVHTAYLLALSIISFFAALATVLVSYMSYSVKTLSPKDLFSRIGSAWMGPMITTFYLSGLAIGFSNFVVMLMVPLLIYPSSITFWIAILLGIVAMVFYLYLFVAWGMAIVVSVMEESCYGMEAFRKASVLVKGKRLHGFLLNISFSIMGLIIFMVYKILLPTKGFANPTLYGLFWVNVSVLMKFFMVVAYTVLYFECKKHHGEEIELQGHVQYTKLPIRQ